MTLQEWRRLSVTQIVSAVRHLCEFLRPGRGAALYYLVFVDVCARK